MPGEEELWVRWDKPVERRPVPPDELLSIQQQRGIVLEQVIGPTADFLPVRFLEQGARRGRSVARIEVRRKGPEGIEIEGHGTGFLVAPHLLMTNGHVLPDVEVCQHSVVQFDYELDLLGNEKPWQEWKLAPERFFVTSPFGELDFTIVGLEPKGSEEAGAHFGTIPLRTSRSKVMPGETVNIVQHPGGRRKEVVLTQNKVTGFFEGGFVHYTADTLRGSSGSPVFNDEWDLIALHHRGVIRRDEKGDPVYVGGDYVCDANEGVRISEIISHLKSDALPPAVKAAIAPFIYP